MPTLQEMQERIAQLEAQLKNKNNRAITLKVSAKGAVSIYGLGKFPVTLYKSQCERLIAEVPRIQEFIKQNADKLKVKGETEAAAS